MSAFAHRPDTLFHALGARLALPRATALLRGVLRATALRKQRGDLLALDDTRLRDIGLNREQVEAEGRLPCWNVPRHWLQQPPL